MSVSPPNADHPHAKKLRDSVSTYCREERPHHAKPFEVHGLYVLSNVLKDASRDVWNSPGCYVIYDDRGDMRYVGMSQAVIGYRSLPHTAKRVRDSLFWSERPPYSVDLVPTWEPWQAPSLEAYLTIHTHQTRNPLA